MTPRVGCSPVGENGFQFSIAVPEAPDTLIELFAAVPVEPVDDLPEQPVTAREAASVATVARPRRRRRRREESGISGSLCRIAAVGGGDATARVAPTRLQRHGGGT